MSFEKRLQSGEFVVLAEMNTPKGVDISRFMTDARRIKGRVDAAVIPDMDNGVMRMSALAGGVLAQQQGLEAIIHVYGRDRNRMALQGDLLAAHVLGIQNLIVVPGEDMANGDHRDAAVVDDLDEMGLLNAIAALQDGKDLAGFGLDGSPKFTVGCSLAPAADEKAMAAELAAAREKVAAGARFVVTPPVFDVDRFAEFAKQAESLKVPLIATIFLIKSVAVARYISFNEPGAHLSEEMIQRIRKSSDREMEGVKIAGETIAKLKQMAQGVLIQTMGWEHRLSAILDAAGM
ncbi:MAG: methylenetetrahydrofolate reductase [Desulfobacterales bacterium]|nr:methylenetetrahydrofolate reductase [Desulfobacterales bacterium]MCF8080389.1 methylenetetrahydrofolate reductase [Desulfobacterales bacterium]